MRELEAVLAEALRRWRGEELSSAERIPGGANSEVFRLRTRGGRLYCAKRYHRRDDDPTDRLEAEFAALSFLWGRGLRCVPEPVGALEAEGIGVYGFITGRRPSPAEVSESLLGQAADFLLGLHALRHAPGAEALPTAKEACFALTAHLEMLETRLARLRERGTQGDGETVERLRRFLDERLGPFCELAAGRVSAAAAARGLDPGAELPLEERTLSPSDVGYHNTLLADDGTLFFLDFEYFGWDDPAKMVADFFLQPQVPLDPARRRPFLRLLGPGIDERTGLVDRLSLVYPLLALKWCLIMLNVFLRPALPGREGLETRERQLALAEGALAALRSEIDDRVFPCDRFEP